MISRRSWWALAWVLALVTAGCGGSSGPGDPTDAPPYTLRTVTPLEGTTAGGARVTIEGTGFHRLRQKMAGILFGENVAQDVVVVDDGAIECTVPPGRVGSVAVTIIGAGRNDILLTGGYRYVASLLYVGEGAQAPQPLLYQFDLDLKRLGLVGSLGYPVAALAVDGAGNIVAAEDGPLRRLLRVDPVSGQATPTGRLADAVTGEPVDITDLTFAGARLLGRARDGRRVEIDLVRGDVRDLQGAAPVLPGQALAAASATGVYLAPSDASAALLLWNPSDDSLLGAAGFATLAPGLIASMAVSGGRLYALVKDYPGSAVPGLVRLDPVTGVAVPQLGMPAAAAAVATAR